MLSTLTYPSPNPHVTSHTEISKQFEGFRNILTKLAACKKACFYSQRGKICGIVKKKVFLSIVAKSG